MTDDILERDEQYQELLILKEKVKQLDAIIYEGSYAEEFVNDSAFYPIFVKTFKALQESYNAEAHKAARDSRAEIANYLGREEAIKDMFIILSEFTTKADAAELEKEQLKSQIKELTQILATPEGVTQDVGGSMG